MSFTSGLWYLKYIVLVLVNRKSGVYLAFTIRDNQQLTINVKQRSKDRMIAWITRFHPETRKPMSALDERTTICN